MKKAIIYVKHRQELLEPKGKAVAGSLRNLGFNGIKDVRIGKYIVIEMEGEMPEGEAEKKVREMCEKLLVNTVIEEYEFKIES
ncbi:MAG: phosphoribosylformylglycinamidine synthase subunit PurS [Nitrospirae bacterium]|nr:phosphoribosylformylglycinamidine synthase subunit PurS [Nitrospirota bacterium]